MLYPQLQTTTCNFRKKFSTSNNRRGTLGEEHVGFKKNLFLILLSNYTIKYAQIKSHALSTTSDIYKQFP